MSWMLVKSLPRLAAFGAGAGMAWSALAVDHNAPLSPALPGSRTATEDGSGGAIILYSDTSGDGTPVLLIHSVNAAASSYEMHPLYSRLQGARPVWALDLPGFGDSTRGDRPYSPQSMGRAVGHALSEIGTPAHVVGLSLGAEFATRAANERPDLVASLSLISPTGFGPRQSTSELLGPFIRFPLWSQAIFDGIASRRSIRYFLSKSFVGPVDEMLVDHAYRTSHQPGARHAALAFLAGDLFTPDATERLYADVTVPTTVLYDRDPFTSFARLPEFIADREGWSATRIPDTAGLPHWDKPTATLDALQEHWTASE